MGLPQKKHAAIQDAPTREAMEAQYRFLDGGIDLGDGSPGPAGNMRGWIVDVGFPRVVGPSTQVEVQVSHGLGQVPIGFMVLWMSRSDPTAASSPGGFGGPNFLGQPYQYDTGTTGAVIWGSPLGVEYDQSPDTPTNTPWTKDVVYLRANKGDFVARILLLGPTEGQVDIG